MSATGGMVGFKPTETRARTNWIWAVGTIVLAVHVVLIAGVTTPPLFDLPNHLARLHVHAHGTSDPILGGYYESFWKFQPNLALDAFGVLVQRWLDVYQIGGAFALLAAASILIGTAAINRALFGEANPIVFLSAFLIINRFYRWGMLGYVFGVGAALAAIAAWLALARHPRARWIVGATITPVLYLLHLYAFGIYALSVAALEAAALLRARGGFLQAALRLTHMLPAALIFVFLSPRSANPGIKFDLATKLTAPSALLPGYAPALELAIFGIVGGIVLLGLAQRAIVFSRVLVAPILALSALFLVMPTQLMTSWSADRRLFLPVVLLVIASLSWRRDLSRGARLALATVVTLFVALHANIALEWQRADKIFADIRQFSRHVPQGSRVASVIVFRDKRYMTHLPLHEAAALFVIERAALVPSLYAFPHDAAQALRYSAAASGSARRHDMSVGLADGPVEAAISRRAERFRRGGFEYLLVLDSAASLEPHALPLSLVASSSDQHALLYELRAPQAAGAQSIITLQRDANADGP